MLSLKRKWHCSANVLKAGLNNSESASESLPMLNKIIGFPTTIIIDKKGKIRQTHAGFSGPGTGKYYTDWVHEFESLISKLLVE